MNPRHPKKTLIIGYSFSGKTHLSGYFCKNGEKAYDAEFVEGLPYWVKRAQGTDASFANRPIDRLVAHFGKHLCSKARMTERTLNITDIRRRYQVVDNPDLGLINKEG